MMKYSLLYQNDKILALLAANSWPIFQPDVKNSFLHGDLKETTYMTPLLGYVVPNTKYVDFDDLSIGLNRLHINGFNIFDL